MEVRLKGRPSHIIEKRTCAMMMLSSSVPELPAGLPTPPAAPTSYMVYIPLDQWHAVKPALVAPDAELMVQGYAAYDADLEGVAVFATSVASKAG